MGAALARAGGDHAPSSNQRAIATAVLLAAALLRVERSVLAARVAAHGARRAVLGLEWGAYGDAVTQAMVPLGPLYNEGGDEQAQSLTALGHPALPGSAAAWVARRAGIIVSNTQMGALAVAAALGRKRADPWAAAGALNRTAGLNRTQAVAIEAQRTADPKMSATAIERRVDQVAARYLRDRAAVIARNEARAALVSGAVDAWHNSLPGGQYELVWVGGTCNVCAPLDGTTATLEEGFGVGLPPLHPHCACGVELQLAAAGAAAA
jgi:hypothetical protein